MMQIIALTVYRANGETRTIHFEPGKLNIITGDSRTGKSSLINIFRYCLGGDSPNVPHGPIRELVAWYGLLARVGDTSFFVGRPSPPRAASGTSAAMLRVGADSAPRFEELTDDTTNDAVRQYIGGLLGIEDNLNVPPPGQTRQPLSATFVHSLFYCFQGQGEIANPDILFHRQNRDWQSQTIKDTLPYFLGAVGIEELRKRQELANERRNLRRLSQKLRTAESERMEGLGRASSLLAEARDAGLTAQPNPDNLPAARGLLADLVAGTGIERAASDTDEFERLTTERRLARDRARALRTQLHGVDDFANARDGYSGELAEQRARLSAIGLIPDSVDSDATCAMCNQPLEVGSAAMERTQALLGRVSSRLASSRRDVPRIERARNEILGALQAERERLNQIDADLDALAAAEEEIASLAASIEIRSYMIGRISQYLDQSELASDDDIARLEQEVADATARVGRLETELDPDALRSKVTSLLTSVNRRLTEWARELDLEHSEFGARIDIDRLTIVADTPDGPAYMDRGEIGSGRNWVGYHLTAYLALQDFFISRARPVPSFIVLDQLSQAFFPRDREAGGDLDELSDTDRAHTHQLYEFLHRTASELDGRLQIIALDHAEFDDKWFQSSIIERWRGGEALIPLDWIADSGTDTH